MGSVAQFIEPLASVDYLISPLAKRLRETIQVGGEWLEHAPDAMQMGRLGFDQLDNGRSSLDGSLNILYLRKTQAEIERQQILDDVL